MWTGKHLDQTVQSLSGAGIDYAVAYRQQRQLDIAADRQLLEDSITVGVDGFRRQAQLIGNALDLLAPDNLQGNHDFPLRQLINWRFVGYRKSTRLNSSHSCATRSQFTS